MTTAQATVDLRSDIPAIVNAAGVTFTGTGHDVFWIEGTTLFVKGCEQAALDAAVAASDPVALEAIQLWNREMGQLNRAIRDDFRFWEESAAGAISPTAATRMAAQVAAAKAHRASRPK